MRLGYAYFFRNWASKYAYPYAYFSDIFIKILRLRRNALFYQDFFQSEARQYAYQFGQYAYFFLKTSLGYAYKWYTYKIGSLSAIFLGTKKKFWGGKIFFGEKMSFFEKKMKKKFLEKFRKKIFFLIFFNIIVPYFDSNRFFSSKITIL